MRSPGSIEPPSRSRESSFSSSRWIARRSGTCTELGIEADLRQVLDRRIRKLDFDVLGAQAPRDAVEHQARDLNELLLRQRLEDDDLVDPVDELRAEAVAKHPHQLLLQLVE